MDSAFIYALVDPNNHVVRYVGQCHSLHERYISHLNVANYSEGPVYGWIRGIAPAKPVLVLLETVVRNRQVEVRTGQYRQLSSVVEAKWLKRFRRTVLNVNKRQCLAFDDFVNPAEFPKDYSTEE